MLKKFTAVLMAVVLMFVFSVSALAVEKENIVTEVHVEDLGNGLTVTETTTIRTPVTRIGFGGFEEKIQSNEGLIGDKYAKYTLSYERYNFIGSGLSRSMFIKCTSDAVVTK